MARLLSWPIGLKLAETEWIGGPMAVSAGGDMTIGGGAPQSVGSPFGTVAFTATLVTMKGQMARRHRGTIWGLQQGANAVRLTYLDPDIMTPAEAGIAGPFVAQPWSNGEAWSNGQGWQPSYPRVAVSVAAALGDTAVSLADTHWGHALGPGDVIGFAPFHLGWYFVTDVLGPGQYRIWPRLAKALTTESRATLRPTGAFRLTGADGATLPRGTEFAAGASVSFYQLFDADVRDYFAD